MKKLFSLTISVLLACSSFAQMAHKPIDHNPHAEDVVSMPSMTMGHTSNIHHDDRNQSSVFLDYDLADQNLRGIVPGGIVVPLNSRFQCNHFFTFDYAGVSFDTLLDANTLLSNLYSASTVTIDTVFAVIGHENNSGLPDTIVINVVDLLNNDTFLTDNILYTDTMISDTGLSPGNSWFSGAVIFSLPGITLNQGEKFGVKIKYFGSPLDTFAVIGNNYDDCSGACQSEASLIYPTSFFYFNYDTMGVNLCGEWPSAANGDIFFDCDNSGGYTPGACESPGWQNFDIFASLTIDAQLAVQAGSDGQPICPGNSIGLTAQGFGGSGTYTYSWAPSTGLDNPFSQNPTASPTTTTTYTVTIDDGTDQSTSSVLVTVNGVTIDLGADQTVACGAVTTITPTLGGNQTGPSFTWSNGTTSFALSNVGAGTYSETVLNSSGCTATDEVTIGLTGVNQNVDYNPPSSIPANQQVTFTNTSTQLTGWSWAWDFGNGGVSFLQDGVTSFNAPGSYTVCLTGTETSNSSCTMQYCEITSVISGIEDVQVLSDRMNIYPNPSNGEFTLSINGLSGKNTSVQFYNVNGQVVKSDVINGTSITKSYDLHNLSNGVYLVKIMDGDKIGMKRMVINK